MLLVKQVDSSLRRAVLHPSLVLTKDDERALSPPGDDTVGVNDLIQRFAEDKQPAEGGSNTFVEQFIANLKGDDITECPICFSEVETPMVIPQCMHQL
jgi:DNA repair protein RAD5